MNVQAAHPVERPGPGLLAVVADELSVSAIEAWAARRGGMRAQVLKGSVRQLVQALEGGPTPEQVIVDVSGASDPLGAISELADVCDPGAKVLVLGERNDIALYRDLMAMGVEDYLVKPITASAIERALSESPQPARRLPKRTGERQAGEAKRGTIVAVVGARGGVGVSTVAGSLAWVLAVDGMDRTALVDIDLQMGTGALMLDIEPGHGFKGALESPERIDSLFIERAMVRINERLSVLCAEEPLADVPVISRAAVDRLFDKLADNHAWVVIDVPRNAQIISRVLPKADHVVVVTDRSLAGVRDSLRLITFAAEVNGHKAAHVVVNRAQRTLGEDLGSAVEKALGRPVSATIPFDATAMAASAAKGQPIVAARGRSAAAQALRRLAREVAGKEPEARPLWQRWIGGR